MTLKKQRQNVLNGLWFNMIQLSGHSEHKRAHFHIHNYNPHFITIIIEYYQICSYVQYMYEATALVNFNFIYRVSQYMERAYLTH